MRYGLVHVHVAFDGGRFFGRTAHSRVHRLDVQQLVEKNRHGTLQELQSRRLVLVEAPFTCGHDFFFELA